MPVYEYENQRHGVRVLVRCAVDRRPRTLVLRRRAVPSHITFGVGTKPPSMGDKLAAGYKKLEDLGQLSDAKGTAHLDAKTIKRAIAMPDPV
jgi:hypothetical protein